jgi:phosphonate transport system permease protein
MLPSAMAAGAAASAPSPGVATFLAGYMALVRQRRRQTALFAVGFVAVAIVSGLVGEVDPARFAAGLPDFLNYIVATVPESQGQGLVGDLRHWYWGLGRWLGLLWDTVVIAYLGTLLGFVVGFGLSFPAARNLVRSTALNFASRRFLEICRSVPELVFALIFVFAFGIGPLAGVLAIAVHTAGALGKLLSEVNENVDARPIEGMHAVGGNWFETMRFGVVPQVLPNVLSYLLLRFEVNVRGAAIIGLVGAGGIGQELYLVIRQFIYSDISAIVLLIVASVTMIDLACERARHRLIRLGIAT